MFYYIEGNVSVLETGIAVVDVGGVGFLCHVSASTLSRLETGKKARLYTYCNIKEDAFDLYGFSDMVEKRCFELLLSVSGIGPKAALSILSGATAEGIALAVATENEKLLTSVPGVGKRIAQRIILELKDKLSKDSPSGAVASLPVQDNLSSGTKKLADVTSALSVLGYSPSEITFALRGLDIENLTTEDVIRTVLKNS